MNDLLPAATSAPSHLQPVPPEPLAEVDAGLDSIANTVSYCIGKLIVVPEGGFLSTENCIKCGKPAKNVDLAKLRTPADPRTWFGKRPEVNVGLCRQHHENHIVALALTWSILSVGAVLLFAGLVSLSFLPIVVGAIAMGASGIFRATSPVTLGKNIGDSGAITIVGACDSYRKQLRARLSATAETEG